MMDKSLIYSVVSVAVLISILSLIIADGRKAVSAKVSCAEAGMVLADIDGEKYCVPKDTTKKI